MRVYGSTGVHHHPQIPHRVNSRDTHFTNPYIGRDCPKTDTLEAGRELNDFGLVFIQCEHVSSHPTTDLVNALINPGNNRKVSSGVTSLVQLRVFGIYDRVKTMTSDDVLQWDHVREKRIGHRTEL